MHDATKVDDDDDDDDDALNDAFLDWNRAFCRNSSGDLDVVVVFVMF